MKRIDKVIPTVLTEIKAPSTKERRTFTPYPAKVFEYETFDDPQLERMLAEANLLAGGFPDRVPQPIGLTFLGSSGTGKSHLAKRLYELARTQPNLMEHKELIRPVQFWFWPRLLDAFRNEIREPGPCRLMEELLKCNFLGLDDIALDGTDFGIEKLFQLVEGRISRRKRIVITSNLTPEAIEERDRKIASRLRRLGPVITVVTLDYTLRSLATSGPGLLHEDSVEYRTSAPARLAKKNGIWVVKE